MQVGDSKQAMILTVVALVVVGASVFHVLPKGNRAAVVAPQVESSSSVLKESNLPKTLLSDPFTHPALATSELDTNEKEPGKAATTPKTNQGKTVQSIPRPDFGEFTPLPPFEGSQNIQSSDPDENTGNNREPNVSPQVSATLVAVLKVNTPTALISHGDFTQKVKVGDKVGKWTVKQISDSEIVLASKGASKKISVGGSVDL